MNNFLTSAGMIGYDGLFVAVQESRELTAMMILSEMSPTSSFRRLCLFYRNRAFLPSVENLRRKSLSPSKLGIICHLAKNANFIALGVELADINS